MSDQPRVMAVMLAAGRQSMAERAVRSFKSQSYPNKVLAILDNGTIPLNIETDRGIHVTRLAQGETKRSIGELRNLANALACGGVLDAEIIMHQDSDDWSAPERMAEQVELLQASGAQVVGYSEVLFWRSGIVEFDRRYGDAGFGKTTETDDAIEIETGPLVDVPGEAWLFSSPNPKYMLGTSLCYWRKTWDKIPFEHVNTAEDTLWQNKIRANGKAACTSLSRTGFHSKMEPRLIASIHGNNTTAKIVPGAREWRRSPSHDAYCREVMSL